MSTKGLPLIPIIRSNENPSNTYFRLIKNNKYESEVKFRLTGKQTFSLRTFEWKWHINLIWDYWCEQLSLEIIWFIACGHPGIDGPITWTMDWSIKKENWKKEVSKAI